MKKKSSFSTILNCRVRYKKAIAITFIILNIILTGCYQHYYRTNTKQSTDVDLIQRLQIANKYFILHLPDVAVGLQNISIKGNMIEADAVPLSPDHSLALHPNTNKTNVVKYKDKDSVFMEVHLYSNAPVSKTGHMSLSSSDINRLDIYETDAKATRSNHTFSTVGVVLVSAAAIGLIAAAIACNCPQVYIDDNGQSSFNGGMYSGAIYSTLERTDYMPLPVTASAPGKIKLSIGNAPNEEQFINNVQLLQVSQDLNEKVLVDRHGKIITYQQPEAPLSARAGNLEGLQNKLAYKDLTVYSFNNEAINHNSDLVLKFKNKGNGSKAKLVINGSNSSWSGVIFKEFSSLFGEDAEKWRKKQEKADPASLEKWQKEQALPIMVYLKEGGNWKYIDYFALTGNTASRDMIMELDISRCKDELVEIKLETVYRFWDLDYAALDISSGNSFTSKVIDPIHAVSMSGTDQKKALLKKDDQYTSLNDNDKVDLEFELPASDKKNVSYFLISSGYYHTSNHYPGKMQIAKLLSFKKKGGFDTFSRSRYQDINEELAKYAIK